MSNYIIGYPDSPYVSEIYENFKTSNLSIIDIITDSIKYLSSLNDELIINNKSSKTLPLYVDIKEYQSYKSVHRGGWYNACEELYKLNSKNNNGEPNGVICDMYVDRTFHWAHPYMKHKGVIPYTGPWCGFIHHTPDTSYSEYNSTTIFDNIEFIQSLHTCLALFVLSEPLAIYLRRRFESIAPHIKVITFAHPIVTPLKYFSVKDYIHNSQRKLINIGAWMRNPFTIYRLNNISLQRAILIGKDMDQYLPPNNFKIAYSDNLKSKQITKEIIGPIFPCRPSICVPKWILMLEQWLKSIGIHPLYYDDGILYIKEEEQVDILNVKITDMIKSVEVINYKSNDDYDDLLSNNIVFLDLIDAAAVNTIIECIVRRTPLIVNKIPGTVALLGDKYPLFYNTINEIPSLLINNKLQDIHKYFKRLDTKRYTIDYFLNQMDNVITDLVNK